MNNPSILPIARPAKPQPLPAAVGPRPTQVEAISANDEIARKAYFIYLAQGCPQGQDTRHWFEAEAQVIKAHNRSRQQLAPKM